MILLVAIVVLAAGTTFAHGKEQHIMGNVIAMTDTSITVQTKAKNPVTVYAMPETKYAKGGAAASMKDLKVGDRVVIHAQTMEDKLMANDLHFGVVAKAPHQP
jgi:hypothetical protein